MQTQIYTFFTNANGQTQEIYPGTPDHWVKARLQLETAGPVSVGTRDTLEPVLSGKGALLVPTNGEAMPFILSPGDRLYAVAGSVNRVKVIIEPIPYAALIVRQISVLTDLIANTRHSGGGPSGGSSVPAGNQKLPNCPY